MSEAKIMKMFKRIVENKYAVVKMQQRGEQELNENEKLQFLNEIFMKSKQGFLERYFTFLVDDDVELFGDEATGNCVIAYYLSRIREPAVKKEAKIKNRRYEAMQRLIKQGEYFGDEAMKSREPLLYDQMIGKYEKKGGEQQQQEAAASTGLHLSEFLMKHLENVNHGSRLSRLKDIEHGQTEEEDDADEEEEEAEVTEQEEEEEEEEEEEDEELRIERDHMRNEFLTIMHRKFLNGEDSSVDYRAIDYNDDYDNVEIESRDLEERYFDEDFDDDKPLNQQNTSQEYDY